MSDAILKISGSTALFCDISDLKSLIKSSSSSVKSLSISLMRASSKALIERLPLAAFFLASNAAFAAAAFSARLFVGVVDVDTGCASSAVFIR